MPTNRYGRYKVNDVRRHTLDALWPDADPFGLVTIAPDIVQVFGTGATGGLVYQTQQYSFSAATALRINGVFDSFCSNYVMHLSYTGSAATDIYGGLCANYLDSTAGYSFQYVNSSSTTVSGARTSNTTAFYFGGASTGTTPTTLALYFYGPYLAQPTAFRSVTAINESGGRILDYAVTHSLAIPYDGFWFLPVSGTITGTLSFYGFKE
jgi:hypothetical protein